MIRIVPANFRDLSYVASRIRPEDREEVEAQVGAVHYIDLAMMHYRDHAYVALVNDNPEAAFGAARVAGNHLWNAWMWGSERMFRAVPAIGRFVTQTMMPELLDLGANRVEARALAKHHTAQRWLEKMGAQQCCRLTDYGISGEEFILYQWTRSHVFQPENS